MSTQVIVKPQGIVTEPNKVGQFPAGACVDAVNVAIRSFGVAESVEIWRAVDTLSSTHTPTGGAYAVSDSRISIFLAQWGTTSQWDALVYDGQSGTIAKFTLPTGLANNLSSDGRTGIIFFRNRLVITGAVRSMVYDVYLQDGFAPTVAPLRNCGVTQAFINGRTGIFTGSTTDTGILPKNTHLSVVTQNKLVCNDKYELLSVPSFPIDIANLSTTNPLVGWSWSNRPGLSTSPTFELAGVEQNIFRTRAQSVGYDSGTNKYAPIATGSSFYKSSTFPLRDVSSSTTYSMIERLLENALGEALLTNSAVAGASALPLPPPSAKCAAVFKGYAFYANRYDPALLTILNPYYWGFIPSSASNVIKSQGIGDRSYTLQTSTSGSPIITGFPDTTGIVPDQLIFVNKTSDGTGVASGVVVSSTGTTVTLSSNATFSGSVSVSIADVIKINGITFDAGLGPSGFFAQAVQILAPDYDIYAVALEPQSADLPAGFYPDYVPTGGITIRARTSADFTIQATNAGSYQPFLSATFGTGPLTISGKQQNNAYCWSESNQPEYVPPGNFAFAGQGEIYQIISTRDALWFFCSDGLFRLSGSGGSVGSGYDWVLDTIDLNLVLSSHHALCVHREYIYAYTNRGLVSISTEGTVRELSDGRVNWSSFGNRTNDYNVRIMQNVPWRPSGTLVNSPYLIWLVADASNDDVLIRVPAEPLDGTSIEFGCDMWAYNTKTDSFTLREPTSFRLEDTVAAVFNPYSQRVLMINSVSGLVSTRSVSAATAGYEAMAMRFQPIYGASPASYGGATTPPAYTQKHWQDVNLSFKTPSAASGNIAVSLRFGPLNAAGAQRFVPAVSAGFFNPLGERSRVGFSVPREAPALANALAMKLVITGNSSAGDKPVALEGIAINYVEFSDERVSR